MEAIYHVFLLIYVTTLLVLRRYCIFYPFVSVSVRLSHAVSDFGLSSAAN